MMKTCSCCFHWGQEFEEMGLGQYDWKRWVSYRGTNIKWGAFVVAGHFGGEQGSKLLGTYGYSDPDNDPGYVAGRVKGLAPTVHMDTLFDTYLGPNGSSCK